MLVIAMHTMTELEIKNVPMATERATMKSPPTSLPTKMMTTPIAVSIPTNTQKIEELDVAFSALRDTFLNLRVSANVMASPMRTPMRLDQAPVKINATATIATVMPTHKTVRSNTRVVGRSEASLMAGIV
jgi:hypothetical protein